MWGLWVWWRGRYKGGIKSVAAAQRFAESVQRDHEAVLLDDAELTNTDDFSAESRTGHQDEDEEQGSGEEAGEESEEESETGGRRLLGALGAQELQGMILTAPSVAPDLLEEEDEVQWSSREIGEDLIYNRPRDRSDDASPDPVGRVSIAIKAGRQGLSREKECLVCVCLSLSVCAWPGKTIS
jgi:hypothetical protein